MNEIASLARLSASLVAALGLACSTGCSSVKLTLQDAHGTMGTVVAYTESVDDDRADYLYAVEDDVLDACSDLFDAAHFALLGGDVPLLTKVSALFSTQGCRRAVDDAERELEAFRAGLAGSTDSGR